MQATMFIMSVAERMPPGLSFRDAPDTLRPQQFVERNSNAGGASAASYLRSDGRRASCDCVSRVPFVTRCLAVTERQRRVGLYLLEDDVRANLRNAGQAKDEFVEEAIVGIHVFDDDTKMKIRFAAGGKAL